MNFTMYAGFSDIVAEKGWEFAADKAVELGFSSVEIFGDTAVRSVDEAKAAREVLESRGLNAVCYSLFANLYKSPETEEMLKRHSEYAAAIGSPYLHHTVLPWFRNQDSLPEFNEAMSVAVTAASEVAKHAEQVGITCIYEDQGFYLNGAEGFAYFFDEMKKRCDNVGVCGDMGNSLFVDYPAEKFFASFAHEIKHVHAKDYLQKYTKEAPGGHWLQSKNGTWLRDTMVGDGVVNVEACMAVLRSVGYKGAIALELCHIEPFETGVKQAMEYIGRFPL